MAPQHPRTDAPNHARPPARPDASPAAEQESELLARLAALPMPAPDQAAGGRIHRRARAAFVREHERAKRPWLGFLARCYTRVEPVMAAGVTVVYLNWAFQSVIALYQ